MAFKMALNLEVPSWSKILGWNIKAKTAASKTPVPKAINGLVFNRIRTITTKGTINNKGEIWKVLSMLVNKLLKSAVPVVSILKLITEKAIKVIIKVGTVV